MARKCLFCGKTNLSNEHILAQWLLYEFGIYNDLIAMTHMSFIGENISQRKHPFSKLINGLICAECNNGWMSDLEVKNKNLISKLMNESEMANTLKEMFMQSKDLSLWAFKNAILFNQASNYRNLVPESHFKDLYAGNIPDNVYIHIGYCEDNKTFETRQSPVQMVIYKNGVNHTKVNDSYKVTFKLKGLLIKVVFYDSEYDTFYDADGEIEIYPQQGLMHDAKIFTDIDDFDIHGAVMVY